MSAHFARSDRHEALDRLADRRLLRELAYVDGRWTASEAAKSFEVTDPATGATVAWVAALDARQTTGGDRCGLPRISGLACAAAAGAVENPAQMVRTDHRRQGGPGAADDARTGQAAEGIARRDRLCRLLRRMVCRGSKTPQRRERDQPSARRGNDGAARAARRRRRGDAVEFPVGHADPQGRRRTRRRLHHRRPSLLRDAAVGAGAGRTRRARRPAGRRVQHRHRRCRDDRRAACARTPASAR